MAGEEERYGEEREPGPEEVTTGRRGDDCTGRTDALNLAPRTYFSAPYPCDDKRAKTAALQGLLAQLKIPAPYCKPVVCSDDDEECVPLSLHTTPDKDIDMTIAKGTLFEKDYCIFVVVVKKQTKATFTTGCACIPK
jgi:hypothetical protein